MTNTQTVDVKYAVHRENHHAVQDGLLILNISINFYLVRKKDLVTCYDLFFMSENLIITILLFY